MAFKWNFHRILQFSPDKSKFSPKKKKKKKKKKIKTPILIPPGNISTERKVSLAAANGFSDNWVIMSAVNVLEPPTRGKVVLNTTLDRSISSAGLRRLQKPPEISFGFVLMTTTITPPFTGLYRISLFRAVILPVVAQVHPFLSCFYSGCIYWLVFL